MGNSLRCTLSNVFRKFLAAFCVAVLGLASASAQSRFTKLDGNKIHYLSFGAGDEAVVFIHGWTCDATFWKMQAPVYEKRRSLLIDLPGHGLSDKPEIPYTMELFARAVDAVMSDAKVRKATLVGHSMGTPVAVQFLRMHPERVAGLVIVDGFVAGPPKDEAAREKQKEQSDQLAKAYRAPDYKTAAMRMLDFMFTKQTPPALREEIQAKMLAAPQYVMASAMEGMGAMRPVTESWPQIPAEAMMVKRGSSAQYQDFLKARFNLVSYREFEGAGHFLMMEQPDTFNEMLREFLDRK
jgi:pimeloyl-ACP methyl ester carboxylesterase